jgi:translation initiation factor 3 subunit I
VIWTAFNEKLLVSFEDGSIRAFDPITGELLQKAHPHTKSVNRMFLSSCRTLLITCSKDYTAKLLEVDTLEVSETELVQFFTLLFTCTASWSAVQTF